MSVVIAGVPNAFSLQLCGPADGPYSDDIAMGGKLTIGGIDESQIKGGTYSVSVVKEGYYQLIITDIKVCVVSYSLYYLDVYYRSCVFSIV